jgi:hypothetical protein
MKRTLTAVGVTLGMLLTTSLASAQKQGDFGQQGQFIISADRLFPLFGFTHYSQDNPTGPGVNKNTTSNSSSSLSFFYGMSLTGVQPGGGFTTNLFYTVPRVGLDYVIIPNVTLGGDLVAYFTLGGSTSNQVDRTNGTSTTTTTDNPSVVLFGIAPRGGYILGLTDMFSLWLRGGLSFYTVSSKSTTTNPDRSQTNSQHQFAIDLDPQLVFTPIPHLGFTAGLTADIPFGGGVSTDTTQGGTTVSTSNFASVFFLGVTVGMLGYF